MNAPTTLLANLSGEFFNIDDIPSTVEEGGTMRGIVSDDLLHILTAISFAIICAILVFFGSIANIVNIVVFVRIGFKETINISLLAIAISDFWSCFSLLIHVLCFNPAFRSLDLPFDPDDFSAHPTWIHIIFARSTSCLTAFITVERCLCVVVPLKVRDIVTRKRVVIFIAGVAVFTVASVSPHFYIARYVWEFDPTKNKSIIVVRYHDDWVTVEPIAFGFHSLFLSVVTFSVVVVSTVVLVTALKRKTAWRQTTTTTSSSAQSSTSSSLSARDARVSKMVVRIAVLFIVCYIPVFFSYVGMIAEPEYDIGMRYNNLYIVMFSFHFALESANSSLNIFIYYSTSSIYKAAFLKLFRRNKETTATTNNHANEK